MQRSLRLANISTQHKLTNLHVPDNVLIGESKVVLAGTRVAETPCSQMNAVGTSQFIYLGMMQDRSELPSLSLSHLTVSNKLSIRSHKVECYNSTMLLPAELSISVEYTHPLVVMMAQR